ncbi:fructose-bisphosphate aldolase class-II-domain-containing protein [Aspergillus floccosus]
MACNQSTYPASNKTWQILSHANKHGYAVGAINCYNDDGILAVIQAAEAKRSPAIIQLFPWTMHFQGKEFIHYVVRAAHAATVPIAVHLDHCVKPEDVVLALTLPIDSIMVDASALEEEENIRYCKAIVDRARERNITVEAEMGRIEGGEDGLPSVDLGMVLTSPEEAESFIRKSGVHFLAPSFGNIHGGYPPGGADKSWDLSRYVFPCQRMAVGAVPDLVTGRDGYTALTVAAIHGHPHVVQLLLEAGADPDPKDWMGRTPLSHAAENGRMEVVISLVQAGMDINATDEDTRWTAEECVLAQGQVSTVEILRKYKRNGVRRINQQP